MVEHRQSDEMRDSALSAWGITVLRYPNESIRTCFSDVVEDILLKLGLTIEDLDKNN